MGEAGLPYQPVSALGGIIGAKLRRAGILLSGRIQVSNTEGLAAVAEGQRRYPQ
jgi:hypothetical protein